MCRLFRIWLRNCYHAQCQWLWYYTAGWWLRNFCALNNCSCKSALLCLLSLFTDPPFPLVSWIDSFNSLGSIKNIQDLFDNSHIEFQSIQCLQNHTNHLGILFCRGLYHSLRMMKVARRPPEPKRAQGSWPFSSFGILAAMSVAWRVSLKPSSCLNISTILLRKQSRSMLKPLPLTLLAEISNSEKTIFSVTFRNDLSLIR